MVDEIDRAAAREAELLGDALAAQARRARKGLGAVSAAECAACDEPIPEARRRAVPGVQLCVDCQARQERPAP